MSKLTRKNIKVFGGNSSNTGTFGSAQAGSGVLTTDIESMQSLSAWSNGMASATIGGQKLLPQEEMEAALRVATYGLANIYQDGIPEYDASTTYYIGSIVKKTGTFEIYGSLTDDNVGNALSDITKWEALINFTDIANKELSNISTSTALINLGFTGQVLNTNGYYKLPNGLILQWGSGSFTGASPSLSTITLPIAFPTACVYVKAVPITDSILYETISRTITTSTITFSYPSTSGISYNYKYIALGY